VTVGSEISLFQNRSDRCSRTVESQRNDRNCRAFGLVRTQCSKALVDWWPGNRFSSIRCSSSDSPSVGTECTRSRSSSHSNDGRSRGRDDHSSSCDSREGSGSVSSLGSSLALGEQVPGTPRAAPQGTPISGDGIQAVSFRNRFRGKSNDTDVGIIVVLHGGDPRTTTTSTTMRQPAFPIGKISRLPKTIKNRNSNFGLSK